MAANGGTTRYAGRLVDAVVLAAGRGSRLAGVAAPFWKPLMVVNHEPLVVGVVRQAIRQCDSREDNVVVVVSPENALPISQVLDAANLSRKVNIVVQPSPRGPGEAFLRALPFCDYRTLILCADNVITDEDLDLVCSHPGPFVVGTRAVANFEEARQFTLICQNSLTFHEGIRPVEATERLRWTDGEWRAWVGPLTVPTTKLAAALYRGSGQVGGEMKIGSALTYVDCDPVLLSVNCYDIGVEL